MDNIQILPGKPWLKILFLLASDIFGFMASIAIVAVARHLIFSIEYRLVFDNPGIRTLLYLFLFTLIMLAARGLYPGWKRSSVIELKQVVEAVSLAYILTSVIIFIQQAGPDFSRSVFILSWFFVIFFLPIGRYLVRNLTARFPWWGEPVVVIGTGARVRQVIEQLRGCPRLGLRPALGMVVDTTPSRKSETVPILQWSPERQVMVQKAGIRTGVIVNSSGDLRRDHPRVYREVEKNFKTIAYVLSEDIYNFMMAKPLDIAGMPAILSEQSLFDPKNRLAKLLLDVVFTSVLFIPILLVGGLIALWIKIDSPGPIFYLQDRIGQNRKKIRIYKFRTMVANSNEVLTRMLADPAVKEEWEHYHKLDEDKRITRAGAWLRRLSLDELPQFINIVRGEMSLVGPRPYLAEEMKKVGDAAQTILHVKPGITGWWQVMGRNDLPFQDRIRLEMYYVSNWSWWLDLFIILKTFWVVLFIRNGK